MRADSLTLILCENVVCVAVDILSNGEYSKWQMDDIEKDLEAISP